jgi:hypothetical protein
MRISEEIITRALSREYANPELDKVEHANGVLTFCRNEFAQNGYIERVKKPRRKKFKLLDKWSHYTTTIPATIGPGVLLLGVDVSKRNVTQLAYHYGHEAVHMRQQLAIGGRKFLRRYVFNAEECFVFEAQAFAEEIRIMNRLGAPYSEVYDRIKHIANMVARDYVPMRRLGADNVLEAMDTVLQRVASEPQGR